MEKYTVIKSFHFGEICQDIHIGEEIGFDANTGDIKIGDFKHKVRVSPILGAIKAGWLCLADDMQNAEESSQKFEGAEESRPLDGAVEEKEEKKKKTFETIEDAQDSIPVDPTKSSEEPKKAKKAKIEIGRENREETDAITFKDLNSLKEEDDFETIRAWDVNEHWQKKRKKLEHLSNINTLMKLASKDEKMRPRIEKRIKKLANLGEEVDHKLSSLNDSEERKIKKSGKDKKAQKKTQKKGPKKAKVKSQEPKGKGKDPKKVPLGRDFEGYLKEQAQSGEIQSK